MAELTDDQLISIYLSGMGAGAGTLAYNVGIPGDRAKQAADAVVQRAHAGLLRDPGFRFEMLQAIAHITAGDAPDSKWISA